jgi:predicted metal-dependent hydrolase
MSRSVPTRRISFEASMHDLPKHFAADGDLIMSHVIASLSSVFPDGEDFFVRSVRHHRDQITDPDLKRQVAGFIGQESMHGREHRALNERLAELGYATERTARIVRVLLELGERCFPPKVSLAMTASLEHFTATLAELSMTDEEFRDSSTQPGVHDLFLWHSLEESEHKAVAFDVYRAAGGGERLRICTMKLLRTGFIVGMTIVVIVSLLGDRDTYKRGELRRSWHRFKRSPLLRPAVRAQLREYDRRGFHPDDRDTSELLAHWRNELFGEDGSLNDKLLAPSTTGT